MTDNSNISTDTDNLEDFEAVFYGKTDTEDKPEVKEEILDNVEDVEEEIETPENDSLADTDTNEDEETPQPSKKKSRYQERIDKLTAEKRDLQREKDAEIERLQKELESRQREVEPAPAPKQDKGPEIDDKNEDGEDKYPLGEFDPQFIRDVTAHTIRSENAKLKAEEAQERQAKEAEQSQKAVAAEWNEKLTKATETYEDLYEKNAELVDEFKDADPVFGQYIAQTIMSMDHGVDVLYYLANNLTEAKQIMAMTPAKATLTLGRLESKFIKDSAPRVKPSAAPEPPPVSTKGTSTAKTVKPDTDNLEDFEKLFYNKKSR